MSILQGRVTRPSKGLMNTVLWYNMNYTIIDETTNIHDKYCKYIYVNNTSLSVPLCKEIIKLYELDQNKYDGNIGSGVDKHIKDTTDLIIPDNNEWIKIKRAIYKELINNFDNYIEHINIATDFPNPEDNDNRELKFKHFTNFRSYKQLIPSFLIQRYTKNVGKYIYHDDEFVDLDNKRFRVVTFLWYLNDIYEGGETVFSDKYAIKPTSGKLVLFPSTWSYPHCGKTPLSDDKYILTGWIYFCI